MSAYMIALTTVHDPEIYRQYVKVAGPILERYGAKTLNNGKAFEVFEGPVQPTRAYIFEFPSREAIDRMYLSPEYKEAIALRRRGTEVTMIVTDELSA